MGEDGAGGEFDGHLVREKPYLAHKAQRLRIPLVWRDRTLHLAPGEGDPREAVRLPTGAAAVVEGSKQPLRWRTRRRKGKIRCGLFGRRPFFAASL